MPTIVADFLSRHIGKIFGMFLNIMFYLLLYTLQQLLAKSIFLPLLTIIYHNRFIFIVIIFVASIIYDNRHPEIDHNTINCLRDRMHRYGISIRHTN